MTVQLDLAPEVEANLSAMARAKGLPLDAYLQLVIEDLAHTKSTHMVRIEDLSAALDALAEMGRDLPHVPSSAFSRQNMYRDHY
jgi:predicted DNA-binding protein